MNSDILLSAGIDIGTTTTHLIISKISISIEGGFGCVPKAKITDKEIIYKSPIYLTPLNDDKSINTNAVAKIIKEEYAKAGVQANMLDSGAVIITGESSKSNNADIVLQKISDSSGRFISAQAGAQLESFLSGKGSGADILSDQNASLVANIDIGGGTTNISFFKNGEFVDDCCLNIGGRLIKFENGKEIVSPTIKEYYSSCKDVFELCDKMAGAIFLVISGEQIDSHLVTDHLPKTAKNPDIITFSGGVGECFYNEPNGNEFSDMGIILSKAIREKFKEFNGKIAKSKNPIRATVIGAGNFSIEISGSTIQYSNELKLPLKNLECISDLEKVKEISKSCAICPKTEKSPDFEYINNLARKIASACENIIKNNQSIVVITKHDISKALGICLKRYLPKGYPFICADSIDCSRGDYIDIGESVANGRAVPIVIKTLVFGG